MAVRPVFQVYDRAPWYRQVNVEFTYNGGFSVSQQRKNIDAIHAGYHRMYPEKQVLEISSKSLTEAGVKLSAFFLPKYVPSLGKSVPVENVYHAGKVFSAGGPFSELLTLSAREAKRFPGLRESGELIGFSFEGVNYPLKPQTIFYDYLYILALMENPELSDILSDYEAFTDIAFNPARSDACQARTAAMFVSLKRADLLNDIRDFDLFYQVMTERDYEPVPVPEQRIREPGDRKVTAKEEAGEKVKKEDAGEKVKKAEPEAAGASEEEAEIVPGSVIIHPSFGRGKVQETGKNLLVDFEKAGVKKLTAAWVRSRCQVLPPEG